MNEINEITILLVKRMRIYKRIQHGHSEVSRRRRPSPLGCGCAGPLFACTPRAAALSRNRWGWRPPAMGRLEFSSVWTFSCHPTLGRPEPSSKPRRWRKGPHYPFVRITVSVVALAATCIHLLRCCTSVLYVPNRPEDRES